jgi:tRNA U55 pseudouridine synthase TruB
MNDAQLLADSLAADLENWLNEPSVGRHLSLVITAGECRTIINALRNADALAADVATLSRTASEHASARAALESRSPPAEGEG